MMQEIMTPQQVAQYLQLHTDTVYRLIRQKKLAAAKIGRAYRVPNDDLETLLMAQNTRPEVRKALFRRVMGLAQRNPGTSSDQLLEQLEQQDEARTSRSHA